MLARKIASTLTVVAVAAGLTLLASSPAMAGDSLDCETVGSSPTQTVIYIDCTLQATNVSGETWTGVPGINSGDGKTTAQGHCSASDRNLLAITVTYTGGSGMAVSTLYCSL
jgi:hypothetical protein